MSTSIAKHHANWRRLVETTGPFLSLPVLSRAFPHGLEPHEPSVLESLRLAYEEWRLASAAGTDARLHREWIRYVLRDVLGHPDEVILEGQAIPQGLTVRAAEHREDLRPDIVLANPKSHALAGKGRLLVSVLPPGAQLERPLAGSRWKESPAGRMAILLRGLDVRLGLVTNGEEWMLVDAPREQATGFTTWRAWLWLDEHLSLRAFRSLLGPSRLFGVAERDTLEALLAESAEHQQEVTDQLGRQVRRAVEILVQSLDAADRDLGGTLLAETSEREVYDAAVTFMMRLVFLFSAEEKGLFPLEDEQYARHYAASTLGEQLREAAEQWGEEVLERRTDAWQRQLAVARAVHAGVEHEDMSMPPYGGALFDPDRFPFLEGRPKDTRWRETQARPLPIHNRTVLHLLAALQYLRDRKTGEAQRLSYVHLDIEQIGHVYEGLLDHTVKRAQEPVISLKGREADEPEMPISELERLVAEGRLAQQVAELSDRSVAAVQNDLAEELEPGDEQRLLAAAHNDRALYDQIRPLAGLVREDVFGRPMVIPRGSLYVTKGSARRGSGTYYTPRSLTEPVVQYALEPLVYKGPAEGRPKEQWTLRSARELLALKVCDMACGSGAFLVQACRYLSERLVESWEEAEVRHPGKVVITPEGDLSEGRPSDCPIPREADERLALARRLVADRCLYGVDINPMAVEMAKLSLWLITFQKHRAFTFLDHAIRCGDSLLGVTHVTQIETFEMLPGVRVLPRPRLVKAVEAAVTLREKLEAFSVIDVRDAEEKFRLLAEADASVEVLKKVGDLLMGASLARTPSRRKDRHEGWDQALERQIAAAFGEHSSPEGRSTALSAVESRARILLDVPRVPPRQPFHWPLEFAEVFVGTDRSGFDAFVGNPPFRQGKLLTGVIGTDYRDHIVEAVAEGRRGSADLCAYFFLRVGALLRDGGMAGLLATNTIAQGDTREVGLDALVGWGFSIPRAVPTRKWPGEANLEVAHVWLRKGAWPGASVLNDLEVAGISPSLALPGRAAGTPFRLAANADLSFIGSYVLGMGFVLTPAEARALLSRDARSRDVLFPYLIGEDLNSRTDQSASRWVINFRDWPLDRATAPKGYTGPVAAEYEHCLAIVEAKVRPERQRVRADGTYALRKPLPNRWWHYADKRPGLYAAIAKLERVLVVTLVNNHLGFARVDTGQVFAHRLAVFPRGDAAFFAVLQSSVHYHWAWARSSTMRLDINYSPSDCFETFPLPRPVDLLDPIGTAYDDHRRAIMVSRQEGLTKTYNRYHSPSERDADIQRLRDLHVQMDCAVGAAYGWTDLDLDHGFHETKQGLRFTISDATRREILDRLLELNHTRHAEEVAEEEARIRAGLQARPTTTKRKGKRTKSPGPGGLLDIMRSSEPSE